MNPKADVYFRFSKYVFGLVLAVMRPTESDEARDCLLD